jgi:hypothetical protein
MNNTVLLAAAAVLAISAGGASAAGAPQASHHGMNASRFTPSSTGLTVLYSQNSNDSGTGVVSDMFGTSFPTYTDQAADDFVVPSGSTWKVKEVDVTGVYFNGPGPTTGENVFFYKDKKGLPGKQVAEYDNVQGKGNGTGSFAIKIPTTKLKAGTYWVSVQGEITFSNPPNGEWGWEVSSVQHGSVAAWQNPGGGFAVCPKWATLQSCLGYGPDLMFALKGK